MQPDAKKTPPKAAKVEKSCRGRSFSEADFAEIAL
jgi:hypothetical protein